MAELLWQIKNYQSLQICRSENAKDDALARLASELENENLVSISVEHLDWPSINQEAVNEVGE